MITPKDITEYSDLTAEIKELEKEYRDAVS